MEVTEVRCIMLSAPRTKIFFVYKIYVASDNSYYGIHSNTRSLSLSLRHTCTQTVTYTPRLLTSPFQPPPKYVHSHTRTHAHVQTYPPPHTHTYIHIYTPSTVQGDDRPCGALLRCEPTDMNQTSLSRQPRPHRSPLLRQPPARSPRPLPPVALAARWHS